MHRSREAGRNRMENHLSRPGDFGRYAAELFPGTTHVQIATGPFVDLTRTRRAGPLRLQQTFNGPSEFKPGVGHTIATSRLSLRRLFPPQPPWRSIR